MAPTEGVGPTESNHFLVVEAHSTENRTDVVLVFGSIWKAPIRRAEREVTVSTTRSPRNDRSLHFLNRCNAG